MPNGIFQFWKNKYLVCVPIRGIKGKVYIRPATTDMDVYNEIFIRKELDIYYEKPEYIIDAGAHIGFTAIWLSNYNSTAKLIAIEPEKTNFDILLKNTKNYPNITCIKAALWSHSSIVEIKNKNADNWNYIVEEINNKNTNAIQALSIPILLKMFKWGKIDLLKMDIEGSEIEVLNKSNEWINSVKTIFIELHDRFRPGCETALLNAIKQYSFVIETIGEKKILRNTMNVHYIQSPGRGELEKITNIE